MDALWLSERVCVQHAREVRLPGYLFVQSLVDDPEAWLNDAGFRAEMTEAIAWAERVVRKLMKPAHVYLLRFGESGGYMHFHVIPRTQAVLEGYLSKNQDRAPYSGARIAAWLWESSAAMGYSQHDIEYFVEAAKREADA